MAKNAIISKWRKKKTQAGDAGLELAITNHEACGTEPILETATASEKSGVASTEFTTQTQSEADTAPLVVNQ